MSDNDQQILDSVRTLIRLSRIAQRACEDVGLTLPQYRTLNSLARSKRRAFELARLSAVSRPAMSALTTGMERLGLIARSDAESDGRGVYFIATDAGRNLLANAELALAERFQSVLSPPALASLLALDTAALEAALDRQVEVEFGPSESGSRPAVRSSARSSNHHPPRSSAR